MPKERKTWVQEPHKTKQISLPQRLIDKGQRRADMKHNGNFSSLIRQLLESLK